MEVAHAMTIEHGHWDAAVEHARRAVAAAGYGANVRTVGVLACPAQPLFFAGELEETPGTALAAVERPDASERSDSYVANPGFLGVVDAEEGRAESTEGWARQAIDFARTRFRADIWVLSLAHLGLALASVAMGRLDEAEREARRGEQLRRSPQPTVGHAHALLVLALVRIARARLTPAETDLEHARRLIAEFPDPGRLPVIAAAVEQALSAAQADAGDHRLVEEPSEAEVAVLRCLATGCSRREIGEQLYISLNTVKTHTRELYRKLGATSREDALAAAESLGLLDLTQSPG